jgi:hypothetical protein
MVMANKTDLGMGLVGLIFFAIGLVNFLQGDGWVVWAILGVICGGVGAARKLMAGKSDR